MSLQVIQLKNNTLKKYLITSIIGLTVTISLLFSFGIAGGELNAQETMRAYADAFSATGILLVAAGALVFASGEGMFDGISYAGIFAVRALIPGMRHNGPMEKYGDYKLAKSEKRIKGYSFLFYVGLAFLLVGTIFTVLYFAV